MIIQLTGGLGNQLFQYAAAKALSLKRSLPLVLDISSFLRNELPELEVPRDFELYNFQGVTDEVITSNPFHDNSRFSFLKKNIFHKLQPPHRRNIYKEPFFHFDKNFFKIPNDVFIKGALQSEKYFYEFRNELRAILTLKEVLYTKVEHFGIKLSNSNSVSVHIRRGDYLRKQIILEWHGVLEEEYYKKALEQMQNYINACDIYYFSDDPEWVEKYLQPLFPGELVSNKISHTHYEDLYLMSCCRHNIIANSSFSWWAAWFNNNPDKKVIAPIKWFDKAPNDTKDLIPAGWIRI